MKKAVKQTFLFLIFFSILNLIAYFFMSLFLDKKLVFQILKWGCLAQLFLFTSNLIIEFISDKTK
jgi:hypothetical protein